MSDLNTYFDKEISWLSFNERVLQEAADPAVPIVDRIRFLGIYSANLDEFFRVRVANIRRSAILETAQENTKSEWNTLHSNIINKVNELTTRFKQEADNIFDEIKKTRINIIFNDPTNRVFKNKLSTDQKVWLNEYFDNRIIRHITPIIIHSKTQLASCIDDDGIYFLVSLNHDGKNQFCLVEIPRNDIERFIILPTVTQRQDKQVVLLDDIVLFFIDRLFNGVFEYDSIDAYSIKLTRDAAYNLTDELDESLLDQMSKGIKQRLKADLVRLVHDSNMPTYMLNFLRKSLRIRELDNLVPGVRYRHFKDFINFPNLGDKELEQEKLTALDSERFSAFPSVFDAITQNDILLYYPYHKFRHFTEFVRQGSYDPLVKEIKINIYRVAKNSRIIQSLIEAVKNGKKVTVVVELKARFDEEANIGWAKRMKDAGINVEFGIETLKVHSKLCIITRLEHDKLVKYSHIGTGNFHESNARVYTDFALFTKHKEICQEVDNVFSFISHSYKRFRFKHLIVSPLTSRRRLNQLIENEIESAKNNKKAEITLKLNNLVDKGLIKKLYLASEAGVKIKLVIRGMCSLVPGIKGQSINIKVISIVDAFLEHPRVMIFHNQGDKLVFITSGDWMERNIDHRVEVGCPIYDETLKERIIHILDLHFKDNVKSRIIDKNNSNKYVTNNSKTKVRSQIAIHEYLRTEEKNDTIMIEATHKNE
jgi:polyphosphate kinase